MVLDCCHRCTTFSYRDFLTTAATEHSHIFCLFCFLYFSMALQSFLLCLLVLNMCWRSESACTMANWWGAFDHKGWATCDSSTQYIKGLWRNHNGGPKEKIWLLEEAKCCLAPPPYANVPSTCKIANWWGVLDGWENIGFHITLSKFKLKNCWHSWALLSWSIKAAKN